MVRRCSYPAAATDSSAVLQETCDNGVDDDCDGLIDEGCYLDAVVNLDGDCLSACWIA